MDDELDDLSDEVSLEERADAERALEAFKHWNAAAEAGDTRAPAAHLVYNLPDEYGPPPESVTLDDLTRWRNAPPADVCRWLKIQPVRIWPPARA